MERKVLIGIVLFLAVFAAIISAVRHGYADRPVNTAFEAVAIKNTAEHTKFLFHSR